MNRRRCLPLLAGLAGTTGRTFACLWDRDTLKDELASNPGSLDLILGQFPHHGEVYYQTRRDRLRKKSSLDVDETNDLAVALVRLKGFEEGMDLLKAQLRKTPEHYATLSNVGVTAKKSGDFQKGADFIEKALNVKPGGHMGLGDWYLKALQWRVKFENAGQGNTPKVNFLLIPYESGFPPKYYGTEDTRIPEGYPVRKEHFSRFPQMVRNDQGFADGFAAFGDFLSLTGNLNLAFLSYTRAILLKHQNTAEMRRRRRKYLGHAEFYIQKNRKLKGMTYWRSELAKAEERIKGALAWLEQFQSVEGELVQREGDERGITIKKVEKELLRRRIHRVTIS